MISVVRWLLLSTFMVFIQIGFILSASPVNGSHLIKNKFRCYICFWAKNDDPCGDLNFAVNPAEAGKYMIHCLACYKQVYYANNGTKIKVLRGCAQERPHYALSCQKLYNEDNSYMETCACTSEYCNVSLQLHHHHYLIPVLLLVWFVFSKSA